MGCSGRLAISDRWPGNTAISSTTPRKTRHTGTIATRTNTIAAWVCLSAGWRTREFLAGDDYSIADMISWPWVLIAKAMGQPLDDFPNVIKWRAAIKERPAVKRGVDLGTEWRRKAPPSEEERKIMFNQTASTAEEAV